MKKIKKEDDVMKFGIDLWHEVGSDRGAIGYIAEETIIDEVGIKVIAKLRALGHCCWIKTIKCF